MTAPALLRQLAQPALDAYQNTVTVTVPTRLLTALAGLVEHEALSHRHDSGVDKTFCVSCRLLAEVERAAKEHTSQ